MKKLLYIFTLLLSLSGSVSAQDPSDPGCPPDCPGNPACPPVCVPVDSDLIYVGGAGLLILGFFYLKQRKLNGA